jgi:hypothetical protein
MTAKRRGDERLQAAFAADVPPARDLAFTVAVMEQVARRRFWLSLAMMVPPAGAAAVVLWAAAPTLQPLTDTLALDLLPALPALTVAAFLALISWRTLQPRKD